MSTLLSVDFDFLIPHGMYDQAVKLGDGSTAHGMFVYDWQMSETRAPEFEHALWITRASGFQRMGLDIQALTKPTPGVVEFAGELSALCNGECIPAWRGDSHGWAGIVARDFSKSFGPLTVVNFDAHHDLGYQDQKGILKRYDRNENKPVHCDDWALIGLHEGWIENYILVYPDWLGLSEWEGSMAQAHFRNYKRVEVTTWNDFKSSAELQEVEAAYFCRSSSWVPPWLDPEFQSFCDEWGYVECIDCRYGQSGSAHDTCKQREWSWDDVAEDAALWARLQEIHQKA